MIPKKVNIYEVGARDGLQNEKIKLSLEKRIKFINLLTLCNYSNIEVGSFVSPKWIPQMEHSDIVYKKIKKNRKTNYPLLVPNLVGLKHAIDNKVNKICVFATASEKFSKKNTNSNVKETKEIIKKILKEARSRKMKVRAYLSCVLGCPYEGYVSYKKSASLARFLIDEGCYEVSLGDTVGYGTPFETKKLIKEVSNKIPVSKIAMHLHDTYGQALANIYASLQMGVTTYDTSVGGLGGCPYAKGASGNVATEDVLYMLKGMGIYSGVDLNQVTKASNYIFKILNRKNSSKVTLAMINK